MKVAAGFRARERVVVNVDSSAARWISALAVLSLSGDRAGSSSDGR